MERIIRTGEFYRHFKNKLYQIIAVAIHSETGEKMVVYQALYGDYQIYVRPYEMFAGEVDHERYPDVKQKYRFERVEPGRETGSEWRSGEDPAAEKTPASAEPRVNPDLLEFLDAESYEKQMERLRNLEQTAVQSDLDSIYLVLDIKPVAGTVSEQIDQIRRYLSMQHHFDGRRLR